MINSGLLFFGILTEYAQVTEMLRDRLNAICMDRKIVPYLWSTAEYGMDRAGDIILVGLRDYQMKKMKKKIL